MRPEADKKTSPVVKQARTLRQNQTDAEKLVWQSLRNRQLGGFKFRRQHPVPPYTVDFFCEDTGLVVEIDGGQHNPDIDADRTNYLEGLGFTVIRFWNHEVLKNREGILETILDALSMMKKSPSPSHAAHGPLPLPMGEGQ